MCQSCEFLRRSSEERELRQCEECNSLHVHWILLDEIEKIIPDEFVEQAFDIQSQTELDGIYFCFDCKAIFGFFPRGHCLGPIRFQEFFWFEASVKEKNALIKEPYVYQNHFDVLPENWQRKCLNYLLTGSLRVSRTSP